jgi:hypothetical protein
MERNLNEGCFDSKFRLTIRGQRGNVQESVGNIGIRLSLFVRFMYDRARGSGAQCIGVDFEKSNSLVLQDSLDRLRLGYFLDFIGLRF